ncbi:MAG TPA: nickel insertion protein, partial [Verrucomicrobiae bacterium]|nr:nickel insertion protein [Verrucomicrobiae bacterium]
MKTLYLDIFSGISGDMFVGALIDLGADARKLERELRKLKVNGYHIHVARSHKSSIQGIKFDVHLDGDEPGGHGHKHHPRDHHEIKNGHHAPGRTFEDIRK